MKKPSVHAEGFFIGINESKVPGIMVLFLPTEPTMQSTAMH